MNAGRDMTIEKAKAEIMAGKIEQDWALAMNADWLDASKRESVALQLEVFLQPSARQSFLMYFQLSFICLSFIKIRTSKPHKE